MPEWVEYEISTELLVVVKTSDGRPVAYYKTTGSAKATSNEEIKTPAPLPKAVVWAILEASGQAEELAQAVRRNERRRLGYKEED